MTTVKGRQYLFWCGLLVVFLLAWLPRLIYPVSRYMVWYNRSVRFWDALAAGDLENTYQQYHPGVTTMWIAGLGLRVYMVTHDWTSDDLLDPPRLLSGPQVGPAQTAVAALSMVIAACIGLVYVLLTRLTDWLVAFIGGCLLALDPFYITHSKLIHVDGLMASFMLVSVLSSIAYLQKERQGYLLLSGIFAGLACLTKSPAWFLIPFTGLLIGWDSLIFKGIAGKGTLGAATGAWAWDRSVWKVARGLALWGIVITCVFFLLWPAMWVRPEEMLSRVIDNALMHRGLPHPFPNFFAGRIVDGDPGPLYYVASLAWKTTLVTLPAICAAILFLIWQRRDIDGERLRPWWYLLAYAGGFLLLMMSGDKKWARYILPVFTALDVVAAWGLVQVAHAIGRRSPEQKRVWIPTAFLMAALIVQATAVLRHHPYYGTHHNLLLGGSRIAQHILHLGDQGEGYDLAARFLNDRPGAERLTAGTQDTRTQMFRSNFVGHIEPINSTDADYLVFFVNDVQRRSDTSSWRDLWEAYQQTDPVWSVSFDGVPYVWIYPAYPHDPEAFDIDQRLGARLGDHIRLLGYRLSATDITAGDALTVTLFWQSNTPLYEDDHVFVHLLSTDGTLVAQHDGAPGQGERPTWSWQEEEVLVDTHTLVIDGNLSDGTYTLSVGMYEYTSMTRLPAVGPDGSRLPEDRVVLQGVRISSPAAVRRSFGIRSLHNPCGVLRRSDGTTCSCSGFLWRAGG